MMGPGNDASESGAKARIGEALLLLQRHHSVDCATMMNSLRFASRLAPRVVGRTALASARPMGECGKGADLEK